MDHSIIPQKECELMNQNTFLKQAGIEKPIICGAMYPCSNPELVAAASEAGGIGIIQPLSLVYVHGWDFAAGLDHMMSLTSKPLGMNVIVEKSAKAYEERMQQWVDIAIQKGVRFFVTALGNPQWVVDRVHAVGGVVYHDVVSRKWAERAMKCDVDGFICVNNRAGGHAGSTSPSDLFEELKDLGLPLICAGGVSDRVGFQEALSIGYQGVQLGTRFIATVECKVHEDYKAAIIKATAEDIVMTERITGVPVAVINTPLVEKMGTKAGPIARWLLQGRRTKHWMRLFYAIRSIRSLKHSSLKGKGYKDFFQAGKSVANIDRVVSVRDVMDELVSD